MEQSDIRLLHDIGDRRIEMRTRSSIDLQAATEPCCALIGGVCTASEKMRSDCGSYLCPFYKPAGCKDWIRVEDEEGISLVPPEEYYAVRKEQASKGKIETWKVNWRSI